MSYRRHLLLSKGNYVNVCLPLIGQNSKMPFTNEKPFGTPPTFWHASTFRHAHCSRLQLPLSQNSRNVSSPSLFSSNDFMSWSMVAGSEAFCGRRQVGQAFIRTCNPSSGCHWNCAFFSADLLVWGEFLFWMGRTENALMWHFSIVSSFSDLV